MTRHRQPIEHVAPSYEQYLATFEKGLDRLVAEVAAMTSESDLTIQQQRSFGYLFSIANGHLMWSKDKLAAAFEPLNTTFVRCLDCCPVAYRRTGAFAAKFGDSEALVHFDLMPRSKATEWIVDHGHKVGYTPEQIERARAEWKSLRRRAA
ncbi:hypothetical protein [Agrobacterium genomosp. 2]|uniref:Uncharacterized protein n=1 Tax=Agrobacterium genomosp. 2 str. CFBP 5494 TaxID=1183436 RepID=A0A9W5EXY8_9HYPH|nr:hypothetical protein [Agrobacterium genomosp. 2]CUW87560.1 hypothetical protein AGR2A_Cc120098 [Agrobacterium genomosp. 2 str. CFBP 5494]